MNYYRKVKLGDVEFSIENYHTKNSSPNIDVLSPPYRNKEYLNFRGATSSIFTIKGFLIGESQEIKENLNLLKNVATEGELIDFVDIMGNNYKVGILILEYAVDRNVFNRINLNVRLIDGIDIKDEDAEISSKQTPYLSKFNQFVNSKDNPINFIRNINNEINKVFSSAASGVNFVLNETAPITGLYNNIKNFTKTFKNVSDFLESEIIDNLLLSDDENIKELVIASVIDNLNEKDAISQVDKDNLLNVYNSIIASSNLIGNIQELLDKPLLVINEKFFINKTPLEISLDLYGNFNKALEIVETNDIKELVYTGFINYRVGG